MLWELPTLVGFEYLFIQNHLIEITRTRTTQYNFVSLPKFTIQDVYGVPYKF